MNASPVVVLGSANMDLMVRQPRWVAPGETMFGSEFRTGPGGKGLNQAVAARRAGAAVAFVGAVGDDDFGSRLRAALEAEGIDVHRLRTVAAPTGIAQITVTDDGENAIVVVAGANADDELTDADRAVIASAAMLVVQLERPRNLLRQALEFARERGIRTVLTPAPAQGDIGDLVQLADVIVPNEGEAIHLTGETDAVSAARALSRRGGTAVVTLGERGAVVAVAGEIAQHVDARRVVAVDTTSAGDTFTGVLVAWLAAGEPWDAALKAATAAAAISVTRLGAAESMPRRAEILAAL